MMLGETIGERAKSFGLQLCGINLVRPCCQVMYLNQIPNFDQSMVKRVSVWGGRSHFGEYRHIPWGVLFGCIKCIVSMFETF